MLTRFAQNFLSLAKRCPHKVYVGNTFSTIAKQTRSSLNFMKKFPNGATSQQLLNKGYGSLYFNRCWNSTSQNKEDSNSFNVQDEDDFQKRVLEAELPTVVDFHAEWCGPCKLLGPRLEAEIDSQNGKVILAKVDIDELGDIAMQHKVAVVPTVIAFRNGKSVGKFEGNIDDQSLKSFIENAAES